MSFHSTRQTRPESTGCSSSYHGRAGKKKSAE
jgi:hypothetical protein